MDRRRYLQSHRATPVCRWTTSSTDRISQLSSRKQLISSKCFQILLSKIPPFFRRKSDITTEELHDTTNDAVVEEQHLEYPDEKQFWSLPVLRFVEFDNEYIYSHITCCVYHFELGTYRRRANILTNVRIDIRGVAGQFRNVWLIIIDWLTTRLPRKL